MNESPQNKHLIVVGGPTASGKTSLAIELALALKCEIISFDSRQFYGDLQIGAALPTNEELSQVPHHFIACRALDQVYSAGQFATDARNKVQELFNTHNHIVAVGGSGLYLRAWLEGLDEFPEVAAHIRHQLNEKYSNHGIEALQQQLQELDPEWYEKVDIHNPQRLIRALEVSIAAGKPYSSFLGKNKVQSVDYKIHKFAIDWPREDLYVRINQRADHMRAQSFLQEAERVYPYRGHYALNTVGYKELFDFIDGKLNEAMVWELIKQNTRRYAKRQITWFKAEKEIHWLKPHPSLLDEILSLVQ